MIKISYPPFGFRIEERDGREMIFDPFRKKWLVLTPEEWVRQNFLQYLQQTKGCPPAAIAIEKSIQADELKKRFDILVYHNARPWLMVECKEMDTPISMNTLHQLLRYQRIIHATYLIVTNGNDTRCFTVAAEQLVPVPDIPLYPVTK